MSAKRYNLSNLSALIVDGDAHAVELLGSMLRAFGLQRQTVAATGGEALNLVTDKASFDLVLCESELGDMTGSELVSQLRRQAGNSIRFASIVVMAGHTQLSVVGALRDSGAHYIVKKPISPATLFDRIVWAAENGRAFVETDTYVGPDRRFRNMPPTDGVWRRSTDLTSRVGEASEPNLSQSEIDSFMKPTRISLE